MVSLVSQPTDLRPAHQVIEARLGKRISPCTLWRWRLRGVNGVRLACVRVGGAWYLTAAAFDAFLQAQTDARACPPQTELSRTPATEERLKREGLI